MDIYSVLLIHPSSDYGNVRKQHVSLGIPLSLLYLAGAIRECCTKIAVFDACIQGNNDAGLFQIIKENKPFLVGINCLFSGNFPEVRRLAAGIKEKFPAIKIVLGGIHPTLYFREIMEHCPDVDAVCTGESDLTFPLLLRYYQAAASGDAMPSDELQGVALRSGNQVIIRERRSYIEDLDALPRPGYEFFDFTHYQVNTAGIFNPRGITLSDIPMPLLSSRSCPNQCYFCAMRLVMGSRFRMRSAANVVAEMKYLHDAYGINYFNIADDNFSFDRQRTLDICDLIIQSGMKICMSFWAGLMIRTLDQEVIAAMCEAGGVRFNLAIESGSDFIRNTIVRKNCGKEKIIEVVSAVKKRGMLANAFFMIGFPEDTEESLEDTIALINELDVIDSIVLSRVNPLPGTRLFAQCVRDGLFIERVDETQLWKGDHIMATSMLDGGGLGRFLLKPYQLTMEKLLEYDERILRIIKRKMARKALEHLRPRFRDPAPGQTGAMQ